MDKQHFLPAFTLSLFQLLAWWALSFLIQHGAILHELRESRPCSRDCS